MKKYILVLLLMGCASKPIRINVAQLPWKKTVCLNKMSKTILSQKAKYLNRCQVMVNGAPKFALVTLEGTVLLPPKYDEIIFEFPSSKAALVKTKEDKTYQVYNVSTGEIKDSPIAYLRPGKLYNGLPHKPRARLMGQYSAPLSIERSIFYVLDEQYNIVKKIENIDTDQKRELTFPAVHSFSTFNTFWMKHSTRLIRHNIQGKVFYQVYDSLGEKVGQPLNYDKVVYLQTRASTSKKSPFNVTPWVHVSDNIYMPLIHDHYNLYFDPTLNHGDFIGVLVTEDEGPPTKTYSGATLVADHHHKFPKALVFKDEKGIYYSKESHDLQGKKIIPKL